MGLLPDHEILRLVNEKGLLSPFAFERLNPYGYDLTLAGDFLIPDLNSEHQVIDPFNPPAFQSHYVDSLAMPYIIIPPHHFVLGRSVEHVRMPRDVIGICLGRSTYARAGVLSHVTPLEAGWEGTVTIEISNTAPLPAKVHVHKGITQVVFLRGESQPERDYTQKGGRYQGQTGVTQGRQEWR